MIGSIKVLVIIRGDEDSYNQKSIKIGSLNAVVFTNAMMRRKYKYCMIERILMILIYN